MVKSYGYSYVKFDIKFGIMATAMVEFWDLEVNIYSWEGGVGGDTHCYTSILTEPDLEPENTP